MTYAEQLRDVRWQRVRLKIMERDNWTCRRCGTKSGTFNVEHLFYYGMAWEVDPIWLVMVCETCHKYLEKIKYQPLEITDELANSCYQTHLEQTNQTP